MAVQPTVKGPGPPEWGPWELVHRAQRAAIARGESRLAEILSMVLEHRQGPLDQDQKVPGAFVTIPRAFYFELERELAELAASAKEELKEAVRQNPLSYALISTTPVLVQLHEALVRHGRNSGVY